MNRLLIFTLLVPIIVTLSCQRQTANTSNDPIDRFALVTRHNVLLDAPDPMAPISVGNGDFAFTADVTGMQSLEHFYSHHGIPLETRTTWAWHSFPNPDGLTLDMSMKANDFHGRKVSYASLQESPAGDYFRKNPHPIPMGQISLVKENGDSLRLDDIQAVQQKLDLWNGLVTSRYEVDGQPVYVETVSHPDLSLVAFKVKSPLLKSGALKIAFRFPYAYDMSARKNKPPLDWTEPERHVTSVVEQDAHTVTLARTIDTAQYFTDIQWNGTGQWSKEGPHRYFLDGAGSDSLLLVTNFSSTATTTSLPTFEQTKEASAQSWESYWMDGGVVELAGSTDPRAIELERRIILSQYLMKVNYAGSFPPQETGLANISWYGKHNSEVYWLHSAQFYQWNHTDLLEKGLQWYRNILPVAMADAESKGFEGARWPKMAGPNGVESPGTINPFIIWNQPNPIYLSELVYRDNPTRGTLDKYKDIVFESAKFLASYAFYDEATDRYILGPPIKSVNESTEENTTQNPSFELAQWYHGLAVAQEWRERLELERVPEWDDILEKLARLTVSEGKYVEIETDPDMYARSGSYSSAMIMALGYLPKTPMVDEKIMANTYEAIKERSGRRGFVSWSMGKWAMTAARLGKQQDAVDIVCNDIPTAVFHKSGYVPRPKEGIANPAYLPVNSAFLAAVGLMAAGWDGAPDVHAPGFPQDGTWQVRVEGLNKMP